MQNNSALNVIHPNAKIGKNVTISPFVTVEENVEIGDNCWIGPNACILSGVRMGNDCKVFPGAIVGAAPQDLKFSGEESIVEIGNHVTIREYCTINRGTKANFKTYIGDHSLIMAYVHVAHDCVIENNVILANNVTLAGHIEIGEYAVVGGLTAVHQFVKIGKHSMIGGGSLVRKCVPPYVKAAREPLSYVGVNSTGLRRRGFTSEQINQIQDIYRVIFIKKMNVANAMELLEAEFIDSPEKNEILDFIHKADRGIMKGFQQMYHYNGNGSKARSNF
ncbi:MAG: acyl-ACP--UDP-N-acetylglucosamine O-acyltransferase [Bacteroidota bacterium]